MAIQRSSVRGDVVEKSERAFSKPLAMRSCHSGRPAGKTSARVQSLCCDGCPERDLNAARPGWPTWGRNKQVLVSRRLVCSQPLAVSMLAVADGYFDPAANALGCWARCTYDFTGYSSFDHHSIDLFALVVVRLLMVLRQKVSLWLA